MSHSCINIIKIAGVILGGCILPKRRIIQGDSDMEQRNRTARAAYFSDPYNVN